MKKIILIATILITHASHAQKNKQEVERDGFVAGLGFSTGAFQIEDKNTASIIGHSESAIGFPNFKLGYMLNPRTAIMATYAGTIYKLDTNKDQSFQLFLPTLQFWVKDRWWIGAGFGIGADSPAIHELHNANGSQFHFGYAYSFSTGFELVQKQHYTFDIQARIEGGRAELENNVNRDALFMMIGIGFNWY